MTTNESSASLGAGRSRSQMLRGLAPAAPCLDKCAGAERDGVRRLQSGNGTCADADAIEAYGCFATCGCFERAYFREMRAVSCPNVNDAEAAHAAAFDDAWTTRVNARLQADCPAEYAKTNTRRMKRSRGMKWSETKRRTRRRRSWARVCFRMGTRTLNEIKWRIRRRFPRSVDGTFGVDTKLTGSTRI